ncbi:MAG: ABC transporter permease [Candidatus Bipolaricaulia bacterium]
METLTETWEYINSHWDRLFDLTWQHVKIIAVANSIAVVLGVIIGIFIAGKGRERIADIVLYLAGIMMTIPSLALFGLMIYLLPRIGLPGIGFTPAVIALVLYGQLPIIRNTYTAIRNVDPAMIEAGRGMGMTSGQLLRRVKLPLAMPIIMAGLRTAIVINIGIAAIAVFIGAGGLGAPIFNGIVRTRMDLILSGTIFVSVLALIFDGGMALVERWITPKGLKRRQQS